VISFYAGAALVGIATIAYQVALARLVAVVNWAPFAFFIISAGMLGMAASGTALLLVPSLARKSALSGAACGALVFAFTAPLGARILMAYPFNPLALTWHFSETGVLAVNFLAIAVPFMGMGAAVVLALGHAAARKNVTYAVNLFGSAAGAFLAVTAMFFVKPHTLTRLCALAGAAAAIAFAGALGRGGKRRRALILTGAVMSCALASSPMRLKISQFKTLSQFARIKGARVIAEAFGPTGYVVALENREVPPRSFPDLSMFYSGPLPEQVMLIVDGDSTKPVTMPSQAGFDVFNHTPPALGYRLAPRKRVLILGAGGGDGVRLARANGARSITAVEPGRAVKRLALRIAPDLAAPDVRWLTSDIRSAVERLSGPFDLVQYGPVGSAAGALAGAGALRENYRLTVESVRRMIELVDDDGALMLSSWLRMPPRDFIKLTALLLAAARKAGVERLESHLAAVRGLRTGLWILSKRPLGKEDCDRVRSFAAERGLDLVYLPDLDDGEVNRVNRLDEAYYWQAARDLLAGKPLSYRWASLFDLAPNTDSRPFFDKTLSLSALSGKMPGDKLGVVRQQEIGDLFIAAALIQALVAFAVLVIAPVALVKGLPWGKLRTLCYFASIGFAYLAVEIAFIQKLTVILGHEIYSVGAVLALLIAFTGLGSLAFSRFKRFGRAHIAWAAALIAAILLAGVLADSQIIRLVAPQGFAVRLFAALCLLAPLGFLMGFFFPFGILRLESDALAWAWAANGCASVAGSILAVQLASNWGFPVVLACAALAYLAAAVCGARF